MATSTDTPTPSAAPEPSRKRKAWLLGLLLLLVLAGIGTWAWYSLVGRWYESTDDAYVNGNVVEITPLITGTVTSIGADDGDLVHAGQVLLQFDPADSQVALQQSVHTLRNLGIECHTARSAKDAINVLLELQGTAQEINVVVSDIEMSEMDGYAFTRTLRETPDFQHLYVLLHTSLDSAMSSEKATQAGANAILTKFSSPELTDCLVVAARAVVFAEH